MGWDEIERSTFPWWQSQSPSKASTRTLEDVFNDMSKKIFDMGAKPKESDLEAQWHNTLYTSTPVWSGPQKEQNEMASKLIEEAAQKIDPDLANQVEEFPKLEFKGKKLVYDKKPGFDLINKVYTQYIQTQQPKAEQPMKLESMEDLYKPQPKKEKKLTVDGEKLQAQGNSSGVYTYNIPEEWLQVGTVTITPPNPNQGKLCYQWKGSPCTEALFTLLSDGADFGSTAYHHKGILMTYDEFMEATK